MMNPDLKGRIRRADTKARRKYCGNCSEDNDGFRICGNNGIMYPNTCLFDCSKLLMPGKTHERKLFH